MRVKFGIFVNNVLKRFEYPFTSVGRLRLTKVRRRSGGGVREDEERVIPAANETPESEIGNDVSGLKDLSSSRTGVVT